MRALLLPRAALPAIAAACAAGPAENVAEERRIGIVRLYETTAAAPLVAPDTVEAGVDFPVTVTTLGGGCERGGETESEVRGGVATVTPYDYTHLHAACPDILRTFVHTASVRFTVPGEATVRAQGRRVGIDTPRAGVLATVEKRVVVR